jgi:hypothetical protein
MRMPPREAAGRVRVLPRGLDEELGEVQRAGGRRVADHDAVPQGRRRHLLEPLGVVDPVIGVGHDAGLRLGHLQHLAEFPAAERRDGGRDHRAQPGTGQVQRRQHPPVRQVDQDDVAAAHPEFGERAGETIGGLRELTVAQGLGVHPVLVRDDGGRFRPLPHVPGQVIEKCLFPPPAVNVEFRRS